ncbi:MAG: HAD family phosphatase [Clostridiales bacterium]|nr:HAD family phosphatase [Clostridiales bacterium]
MEQRSIKGAIFDLDGTLLDSLGVWGDVDRRFFERRGLKMPSDYQTDIKGLSFMDTARYTKRLLGLTESPEEIAMEWQRDVAEEYALSVPLKPGAGEYLRRLADRGIKLALATTNREELFAPCLKRNGVYDLFSAFAITDETGESKSTGKVYRLAAERLGLDCGDCAVFEDILSGINGAKSAGFVAVCVYDPVNNDEWDALRAASDFEIRSFKRTRLWI